MPRSRIAQVLALFVPLALIGGALFSQHVGGLFPCEMCLWQRWPHYFAIGAAALSFAVKPGFSRTLLICAATLGIAVSGAIGAFHAGVEYGWWEGLTQCATNFATGGSALDAIMNAPLVRCDVAAWDLFGISLAGWNAIVSLGSAAAIAVLMRGRLMPKGRRA